MTDIPDFEPLKKCQAEVAQLRKDNQWAGGEMLRLHAEIEKLLVWQQSAVHAIERLERG